MIQTKQLKSLQDFENLKKGDVIACEFKRDMQDYPKKSFRFKVFEVVEVKLRTTEIVLQKKNNLYFNYLMFVNGESNLLNALLLNCN